MTHWQDIATAPRDGSWVMLWVQPGRLDWNTSGSVAIGSFDSGPPAVSWVDEKGVNMRETPTHWMPLPSPPTLPQAEK